MKCGVVKHQCWKGEIKKVIYDEITISGLSKKWSEYSGHVREMLGEDSVCMKNEATNRKEESGVDYRCGKKD